MSLCLGTKTQRRLQVAVNNPHSVQMENETQRVWGIGYWFGTKEAAPSADRLMQFPR